MLDEIFADIKNNLKKGIHENKTAYRYASLSTVDDNQHPQQRTIVLRAINPNLEATIYTDERSGKIADLRQNPAASLLFLRSSKSDAGGAQRHCTD